jgi:transcription initiation factor IIE alpha subunit
MMIKTVTAHLTDDKPLDDTALSSNTVTTTLRKVRQFEEIRYNFTCPNCGEFFDEDHSMLGKTMHCTCGEKFEIGVTEYA